MNNPTDYMKQALQSLEAESNLRRLPALKHDGQYIEVDGRRMLNLSSNDYMGLAACRELREEFLATLTPDTFLPTSSSSRLLTGNFAVYDELEEELARCYGKEAALVFGSGYHANTGILPAVADSHTAIVADKLVHASLIDGMRLSQAGKMVRYRHNDLEHAEKLVAQLHTAYDRIIIVTESLFSMDGDGADLQALADLKRRYPGVMLYVDEAHAFGVRGPHGLGCAEEVGCVADIDFLVGTLGKAAASAGAFVVCSRTVREFLVNRMRTFIFTTALPPVNVAWTLFIVRRLAGMEQRRRHLADLGLRLRQALHERGFDSESQSHIVPMVLGENAVAVAQALHLQRHGFYALPVRPPTVPQGTSRIRFSLTAAMDDADLERLIQILPYK